MGYAATIPSKSEAIFQDPFAVYRNSRKAIVGICNVLAGAFVAALCLPVPRAQAGLVDRRSGMLYDTVLNVTWLQDANYAKTSGDGADGLMNCTQANTWANNLVYGGYSDWRLAARRMSDW